MSAETVRPSRRRTLRASSEPPDDAARPPHSRARYALLASLFVITAINYLDRTNLSVALPHITKELRLNATESGLVLSAFSWIYTLLQVPGGWLVDRVGPKLSYGYAMIGWSLTTLAMFAIRSLGVLVGLRVALGTFETPAFPANNRLVTNWFPARERGRATAVYTSGEYVGLAVAVPALSLLITYYGWRSVFVATGMLGLLFSAVWFRRVHDTPTRNPRTSREEISLIVADQQAEAPADSAEHGESAESAESAENTESAEPTAAGSVWSGLRVLLTGRKMWALYIAQFANASVLFFFLTWFPSYLVEAKHMSTIKAGFWGSLPYLAALVGCLTGGQVADALVRRGVPRSTARKIPVMTGLFLAPIIVAANYTNSIPLVITFMSIAFFAQGLMQTGWTILSDVAPRRLMGLAGGVFSFVANAGGLLAPIVVGLIIQRTGSFAGGLVYVAALTVAGFLAYLFMLGEIERLPDLEDRSRGHRTTCPDSCDSANAGQHR